MPRAMAADLARRFAERDADARIRRRCRWRTYGPPCFLAGLLQVLGYLLPPGLWRDLVEAANPAVPLAIMFGCIEVLRHRDRPITR